MNDTLKEQMEKKQREIEERQAGVVQAKMSTDVDGVPTTLQGVLEWLHDRPSMFLEFLVLCHEEGSKYPAAEAAQSAIRKMVTDKIKYHDQNVAEAQYNLEAAEREQAEFKKGLEVESG